LVGQSTPPEKSGDYIPKSARAAVHLIFFVRAPLSRASRYLTDTEDVRGVNTEPLCYAIFNISHFWHEVTKRAFAPYLGN
jgi:hypothetical protein